MKLILIFLCIFGILSTCTTLGTTLEIDVKNIRSLSEKIGNFSIELLYRTIKLGDQSSNIIISPITVWTVLAVIAEGASNQTYKEISRTIRLPLSHKYIIKDGFKQLEQYLTVNTSTVELQKFNALFVDYLDLPLQDFIDTAKTYETRLIPANFTDSQLTSKLINTAITTITRGHIQELVTADDLDDASLVLTSAIYFRGQWTIPFNASTTIQEPFYDSHGRLLGMVNMMYNRYSYPFASISSIQARVIELSYGTQDRLSMLVMLPYQGVTISDMIKNFSNTSLDELFKEIKAVKEEYADEEVDCLIPRFKIESSILLKDNLKDMGIHSLFDENKAQLPLISPKPLFVSKFIHKAKIEVTEQGTTASAATAAEFSNRISVMRFEANRPFAYLIIEKTTNTITFGGIYQTPSLY